MPQPEVNISQRSCCYPAETCLLVLWLCQINIILTIGSQALIAADNCGAFRTLQKRRAVSALINTLTMN